VPWRHFFAFSSRNLAAAFAADFDGSGGENNNKNLTTHSDNSIKQN
jgi:hypothetical protein